MYVMLDKEKENWVVSRLKLKHSHPCRLRKLSTIMSTRMHHTDNNEASIRPNKTYLALANEVGGSSNLSYSEKDVRNYITSKL
ncbi:hypothetical protein Ahy_A04g019779 [Arachis hypogaea]|uniref:FAR1 domain-containing protein n=1 Tax=Arachis hypogaea TaxID=3818 RepID=A0A445DGP2_ARAHY|nr:hypothetical protein Ahy_A04g019779 [Arachis hypogaea]